MLIDSHAHLLDERLKDNIDNILSDFANNDVEASIEIGCDVESSKGAVELANKYDNIYAVVGYHPFCAEEITEEDYALLETIARNKKVVAIGEIGLDYHYDYDKTAQKSVLIKQIILADKLNLPIVIHLREAYQDMEEILKEYKDYINNGILLHCYSGSKEMIDRFSFLDPYYAFGGAITFKNNNRADVIRKVSRDRLLVETDCPYLTPAPHRGELNTPNYLKFVAERMALDLGIEYEEVVKFTNANTKRFYRIK
ncbi:MAG: TatD family hydrolase [Clostridia bacterium]|nr:TatD family hydrolase [Clostridia bacterium]